MTIAKEPLGAYWAFSFQSDAGDTVLVRADGQTLFRASGDQPFALCGADQVDAMVRTLAVDISKQTSPAPRPCPLCNMRTPQPGTEACVQCGGAGFVVPVNPRQLPPSKPTPAGVERDLGFSEMLAKCWPPDLSPGQTMDLKRAYMGGALVLFSAMLEATKLPAPQDLEAVSGIKRMLDQFYTTTQQQAAQGGAR